MKVQQFIANVGGFANIIRIVIFLLSKNHIRFLYIQFIKDLVVDSKNHGDNNNKFNMKINTLKKQITITNNNLTVSKLNKNNNNLSTNNNEKQINSTNKLDNIIKKEGVNNDRKSILVNKFNELKNIKPIKVNNLTSQ